MNDYRRAVSRWVVAGALAISAFGCAQASRNETASAPVANVSAPKAGFVNVRAMIIVRHGDVDVDVKRKMGDGTPLLPRGEARTAELGVALKDAGITRVFTTQTIRTEKTAEAGVGGKLPVESPFKHGAEPSDVLAYLSAHTQPNDVVLLVENHGTIQGLLQTLGYRDESLINERTEFDRLYVVLPNAATGTYRVMRLRYGGQWGE